MCVCVCVCVCVRACIGNASAGSMLGPRNILYHPAFLGAFSVLRVLRFSKRKAKREAGDWNLDQISPLQ